MKHLLGCLLRETKKYRDNRILKHRHKYWLGVFQKNTDEKVLTEEEKKSIKDYFSRYHEVDTSFHNFYKEKTGNFFVNYIPDDIYYCYIDPYFNNWKEASYIDNKCMYQGLFRGVLLPDSIMYRMNGIWFDDEMQPINDIAIRQILNKNDEFFVKVATESEGGSGVFFISGDKREKEFWSKVAEIEVSDGTLWEEQTAD